MAVYDEKTRELIENPDLSKGYVYPGKILLSDSDNSTELEGTDGLKVYHSDPVYEDCQFYHEYTPEEASLTLLKTSYSVQQDSPSLSYKITTVYLNDYDVEGPDHVICFGTWGSYGIEQLQVIRGSGWEDLTIKATFNVKGTKTAVVVPDTGLINVPPEATRYPLDAKNPGYIVFTGVTNGVQRNSKNLMFLVYGHAEVDLMSAQETPSEWEQFVTQVKEYTDASEARVKEYSESAASSAEAAKTAQNGAEAAFEQADEILAKSLRTLHGGVVKPDTTGDFDPSRPYESESAASVTVKAKGDRFMGAKVSGFTTQAGTGDPSPENVREISTAGMRMEKKTFDGDSGENWKIVTSPPSGYVMAWIPLGFKPTGTLTNYLKLGYYQTDWANKAAKQYYVIDGNNNLCICVKTSETISAFLKNHPLYLFYASSLDTALLYIPIQAQGHEYRCQCLELTASLCAGDKVESCVPSGCDKAITVDGSTVTVTASGSNYVVTASDAAAGGNVYAESLAYLSLTAGQIVIPASSFPASVTSAQMANTWLQSNPQKVWYRSTAYTEANDIPVQLETHASAIVTVDGTNTLFTQGTDGYTVALPGAANGSVICNCFSGLTAASGSVTISASQFPSSVTSLEQANTWAQSNPVITLYPLSTPAIYAHDPVELVAVPYTEADATTAQQLAATPSMLPYYDSADIPMLLNEDATTETTGESSTSVNETFENAEASSVQNVVTSPVESSIQNGSNALDESAIPNIPVTLDIPRSTVVAGTFILSSQEGTTIAAIFYAFQDHGDAKTLCGKTLEDIKNEPVDFIGAQMYVGPYKGPVPFDEIKISSNGTCKDGDILAIYLNSNTGVRTVNFAFAKSSGVPCVLTCKSDNATDKDIVIKATVYTDRIHIDSVISGGSESFYVGFVGAYLLCRTS